MSRGDTQGCVYVFSNPLMPDLVKIGRTSAPSPLRRLKALSSTAVIEDFRCEAFATCADSVQAERWLHHHFDAYRCKSNKEFFALSPAQVRDKMESMDALQLASPAECESLNQSLQQSRPALMNYLEMGLKQGDILVCSKEPHPQVSIASSRQVWHQGKPMELGAAIRQLFGEKSGVNYTHWSHQGRSLAKLYQQRYHPKK